MRRKHGDLDHPPWKNTGEFEETLIGASFSPKMKTTTAGAYYRLLYFLRGQKPASQMHFCDARDPQRPSTSSAPPAHSPSNQCYHDTIGADIILLSQDDVEFPAHTAVLRLASADALFLPPAQTPAGLALGVAQTLPVIRTSVHSRTLAELLRLCYPFSSCTTTDVALLCDVYVAATQLHALRIASIVREQFGSLTSTHHSPVSLYFMAVAQGWQAEALGAAKAVATRQSQHTYALEMENMSARSYHDLLRVCHESSTTIDAVLKNCLGQHVSVGDLSLPLQAITFPVVQQNLSRCSCRHSNSRNSSPAEMLEKSQDLEQQLADALSKVCSSSISPTHALLSLIFSSSSSFQLPLSLFPQPYNRRWPFVCHRR